MKPDFVRMLKWDCLGVIVTVPGGAFSLWLSGLPQNKVIVQCS